MACNQLIPHCLQCEADPTHRQAIRVKKHPNLPNQNQFQTCGLCDAGKYWHSDAKSCNNCENEIEGCTYCDKTGMNCLQCREGYFLAKEKET